MHTNKSPLFSSRFRLLVRLGSVLVLMLLAGMVWFRSQPSSDRGEQSISDIQRPRKDLQTLAVRFEGVSEEKKDSSDLIVRRRALQVPEGVVDDSSRQPTHFDFDLFDDASFRGEVRRTERPGTGRVVYQGPLEGGGDFILARHGKALAGHLHTSGRGQFRIRSGSDGGIVAEQWNPEALPDCTVGHGELPQAVVHSPSAMAENRARTELHRLIRKEATTAPTEGSVFNGEGQQGGSRDGLTYTEIDVMVVYTAAARSSAGGTDEIGAIIDLAMARANSVFVNSEVGIRLRLVRLEEVAYAETNHDDDLDNLKDGFGLLSSVPGWRDASGADLVAMVSTVGGGLAFLYDGSGNSADFAYSVNGVDGLESTLVHEIGHNLSLRHDRDNDSTSNPLYTYSYGWRFTPTGSTQRRTVMAYAPGSRIPYFSNPDVTYMGEPTGVAIGEAMESNNAEALRNTKDAIAAFRGAPGNTPPVVSFDSPEYEDSFLALDDVALNVTATDSDGTVTEVRFYRLMSDEDFPFSNTFSTSLGEDTSLPYSLTEMDAPAGFWTYAVAAFDNGGSYGFDTVSVVIAPHYRRNTFALPSGKLRADVTAINPSGRVVGYGYNLDINSNKIEFQAAYWENGSVTTLPALSGDTGSKATAVDDSGVIYGESISAGGVRRAVSWDGGSVTDLSGVVGGGYTAESVVGVDEQGRLYFVGDDDGDTFDDYRRFDDPGSTSPGLNENWERVSTTGTYATGYDYNGVDAFEAMRWQGSSTLLPAQATYVSSWGEDTNRSGAVIGYSNVNAFGGGVFADLRATFWPAGSAVPVDLGTFGAPGSIGYGLNDFNYAVGTATDPADGGLAFLWKGTGSMINLNQVLLPDGGTLREANAINNRGQIAGTGFDGPTQVVFRLDPLPGLDHNNWLGEHFLPSELGNASLTDDDVSPSGDGIPNLYKRAFGLDPRRSIVDFPADADALPRLEVDAQGYVTFTIRRLRVPGDLTYETLATTDLLSPPWQDDLVEVTNVTFLNDDIEEVTLRSLQPLSALLRFFIHLDVQR